MDLSSYDTTGKEEPRGKLNLIDLDGKPMIDEDSGEPVTITLVGLDSKEYIQAVQDNQTRRLNAARNRRNVKITGSDLDNDALAVQIACTKDWSHIIWQGKELECIPANVRMVYERLRFIRDQVAEFIEDRANFLGNLQRT